MSCVVRLACGKTSTKHRADAAVSHGLWDAPSSGPASRACVVCRTLMLSPRARVCVVVQSTGGTWPCRRDEGGFMSSEVRGPTLHWMSLFFCTTTPIVQVFAAAECGGVRRQLDGGQGAGDWWPLRGDHSIGERGSRGGQRMSDAPHSAAHYTIAALCKS